MLQISGKRQGTLSSWLVDSIVYDRPHNYAESTRNRHTRQVIDFLRELAKGDEGRERYLANAVCHKLELECDQEDSIRRGKVQAVERLAADGIAEVLGIVQPATGRANNHNRVVRQIILTAISSNIPGSLRGVAAQRFGVASYALRDYSRVVDEIMICDNEYE